MDRHTVYVQKRPTDFFWSFTQQRIPTCINQIFSCFMGRWYKRQHYSSFPILYYLWESVFVFNTEGEKKRKAEETSLKCSQK